MKVVNRETFLKMPEGTVFCKIQFRKARKGDGLVYSDDGWDSSFDIENPGIKGETLENDFTSLYLGDFSPKEGSYGDGLSFICDNLGKEVPFELTGQRDGLFEGNHVHFAIFSKDEVQEIINELQHALKSACES